MASELAAQILEALYLAPARENEPFRNPWQFMLPDSQIGLELHIDLRAMRRAALTALTRYPTRFAGRSIEEVSLILQGRTVFYLDSVGLDNRILKCKDRNRSVYSLSDPQLLSHLAKLIHQDFDNAPQLSLYLHPVWGWRAPEIPITEEQLIWLTGNAELLPVISHVVDQASYIRNGVFPPLSRWDARSIPLGEQDSWIGCFAANQRIAQGQIQRIKGALSLALSLPGSRHLRELNATGGWLSAHPDACF